MLLDNVKELVAIQVGQGLAARDGHDFSFNAEKRLAALHLDLEAVAGEGHDLFAEDDDLGLAGKVGIKDAYWLGDGCQGHFGGGCDGGCSVVGFCGVGDGRKVLR